jgi:Ser/Thr protein kinase RdoA (MazF antagonist)
VDLVLKILDLSGDDTEGLARAEDRLRLVGHLASHGAGIVRPLPASDGGLFVESREADKCYIAYCYRHAAGRTVQGQDMAQARGAFCRAVGAELGRMHRSWESHPSTLRPDGSSDASAVLRGGRDEMSFFRGWCQEERVGRAWDRLREGLAALPVDKRGYGFVHNDAHIGNLIFDPDSAVAKAGGEPEFTVIDFDVANFHWFMNDSTAAIYSFRIGAMGGIELPDARLPAGFEDETAALFWEGYRRFRDPGDDWLARMELFMQYRRCLLFMPFQEETRKHPAWREHWIRTIEDADRRLFG